MPLLNFESVIESTQNKIRQIDVYGSNAYLKQYKGLDLKKHSVDTSYHIIGYIVYIFWYKRDLNFSFHPYKKLALNS